MDDQGIQELKKNIIAIGQLLWEKDLSVGLSGNLSIRVDERSFLVTATQTCLGLLRQEDVVLMDMDGNYDGNVSPSTEWHLHRDVYQALMPCCAIVHAHALHTNAFFLNNDRLKPKILEAKHVVGDVPVVDQHTLNVEDCVPVVDALNKNSLVVLKNHGCLSIGKDLFECFVKLQTLEEAVKTDIICKLYA